MLSLLSWAIAQSPQRLEAWAVRFGDGGCGVVYFDAPPGATVLFAVGPPENAPPPSSFVAAALGASRVALAFTAPSESVFLQMPTASGGGDVLEVRPAEAAGAALVDDVLVRPDGWTACAVHATPQAAIDAAADGSRVLVAPGTWRGDGNCGLRFKGRSVSVEGLAGAARTVLDCEGDAARGSGVAFVDGEGSGASLRGISVVNAAGGATGGGALRIGPAADGRPSSPTILDCVFADSAAPSGGGASIGGGSARLTDVTFARNRATAGGGGGVDVQAAEAAGADVTFESVVVVNNTAEADAAGAGGGAGVRGAAAWLSGMALKDFFCRDLTLASPGNWTLYHALDLSTMRPLRLF